jgi:hypothetical protein
VAEFLPQGEVQVSGKGLVLVGGAPALVEGPVRVESPVLIQAHTQEVILASIAATEPLAVEEATVLVEGLVREESPV